MPKKELSEDMILEVAEMLPRFRLACDRLERWITVRPTLCCSRCPYARALIIEMLDASEVLAKYMPRTWTPWVELCHELLTMPPPRAPRTAAAFHIAAAVSLKLHLQECSI